MRKLPAKFDWVTVRHKCSVADMFEELRQCAEANVTRRNEHDEPEDGDERFGFADHSQKHNHPAFGVWDRSGGDGVRRAVDFSLEGGERVVIRSTIGHETTATLTLNDDGECKFLVGDYELDIWQILRRVLEPLLFGR